VAGEQGTDFAETSIYEQVNPLRRLPDSAAPHRIAPPLIYASRYAFLALMGIASEDDHGRP
jgi:hypothetical protein